MAALAIHSHQEHRGAKPRRRGGWYVRLPDNKTIGIGCSDISGGVVPSPSGLGLLGNLACFFFLGYAFWALLFVAVAVAAAPLFLPFYTYITLMHAFQARAVYNDWEKTNKQEAGPRSANGPSARHVHAHDSSISLIAPAVPIT